MLLLANKRNKKRTLRCILLCTLGFNFSISANTNPKDDPLTSIKQAITSEKNKITQVSQQRIQLEKQLKQDELAIGETTKKLTATKKNIKLLNQQLTELSASKNKLTSEKQQQEILLAKQIRAAYSSGKHDYLKLLLNQQKPNEVQHAITYYQYLNNARIEEIEAFKKTIAHLLEVVTKHQTQSNLLKVTEQQQLSQQKSLTESKISRSKTITQLNQKLQSSQQKLAKLAEEEANLLKKVKRLTQLAKHSRELKGLSNVKGKLRWPLKAPIKHSFGSNKQGYLKWKGVLISAPSGKTVNSIYHGKVLFADWLKGYGLVTVVDHGNGYMSLYGHNQSLLKAVGDTVETGEAIALSGQSGGQTQAGLYFEIRYKGQAVNPKLWCR